MCFTIYYCYLIFKVSTLRRAQQDSRNRQSMLESKVQELESLTKSLPRGASSESNMLKIMYGNICIVIDLIFLFLYISKN